MNKNAMKNAGQVLGYIGAATLFIRFIPLLHEQMMKPREINLYFLYLEMFASITCGISAIMLNAFPLFIANSLSCLCVAIVLIAQIKIRVKKKKNLKTQNKEANGTSTNYNENTINENTITTKPKKESELKDAAKNTDSADLISIDDENRNNNPTYLPLYELQVPERLSPTYKML